MDYVEKNNINNIHFLNNMELYHGKKIELSVSQVLSEDPLQFEEANKVVDAFNNTGSSTFSKGGWWSISGTVSNQVLIINQATEQHFNHKIVLSLVGCLMVLLYLVFLPPHIRIKPIVSVSEKNE